MSTQELADYIKRRRKELKLSVQDVADRTGLTRQAIYKLVGEEVSEVKLSTFIKVARGLEVHPLDLIRRFFHKWQMPVCTSSGAKYLKDSSGFVRDVTIPDNSLVTVNQEFEKIWEIANNSNLTWMDRRLVCQDEELVICKKEKEDLVPISSASFLKPKVKEIPIPITHPGEKVQLSVVFQAPAYPCTTLSYWKMVDNSGELCFKGLHGLICQVVVVGI